MAVNKLNDRVIKLMQLKSLTAPQLAKSLGYPRVDKIYNIVNKKTGVSQEIISDILKVYKDVSSEWLINGEGEPIINALITTGHKGVPVYDVDFTAGNLTQLQDMGERIVGFIDFSGYRKCVAFVRVKGNSMFPMFTAGDIIGLEPQFDTTTIEYGQPFGIVTKSGENLLKFIRKGKDNDHLILRSNNKEYDDIDLHKNQIERLYKARGPIRDTFI